MNTTSITPTTWELYMFVKDAELIRRMMNTHHPKAITARQLSRDLGFSSHSYVNRILSGQVRTVTTDTAVKIAYLLGSPVDLLFDARVSANAVGNVRGAA